MSVEGEISIDEFAENRLVLEFMLLNNPLYNRKFKFISIFFGGGIIFI